MKKRDIAVMIAVLMAATANTVTLNEGAAAIIPPQTISSGATLLSFTVPGAGLMEYNLPDAVTFQSGYEYTYNVTLSRLGISTTSEITPWDTDDALGTVTQFDPINRIKLNPLWYVAEYNVNYMPASGTAWDNGAGTFSFAVSDNEGYYFFWRDAMKFLSTAENLSAETPTAINTY